MNCRRANELANDQTIVFFLNNASCWREARVREKSSCFPINLMCVYADEAITVCLSSALCFDLIYSMNDDDAWLIQWFMMKFESVMKLNISLISLRGDKEYFKNFSTLSVSISISSPPFRNEIKIFNIMKNEKWNSFQWWKCICKVSEASVQKFIGTRLRFSMSEKTHIFSPLSSFNENFYNFFFFYIGHRIKRVWGEEEKQRKNILKASRAQ